MAEKMSKSRGNVITIEEVVHGVVDLHPGWEFCIVADGRLWGVKDYKKLGVWRSPDDGQFYAASRCGQEPVFLMEKGGGVRPPKLLFSGVEIDQHPDHPYWPWLLVLEETDEKNSPGSEQS